MARRWAAHVDRAKHGSRLPLHNAIRKYGAGAFTSRLLERMSTPDGARRAERLWIAELGAFGPRGYNATAGGEGVLGYKQDPAVMARVHAAAKTPEAVAKMAATMRGRRHTTETIAKMSATKRGRAPANVREWSAASKTPEALAKIAAALRGRPLSAEHRAKLSAARTGLKQSPQTIEKRAAALRGRVRPPEVCAKISGTKRRQAAEKKAKNE